MMSCEINKADIENLLKTYSGDLARKSIRSALDKTATWSKNYIANEIAKAYNLPLTVVKKAMKVKRTTQAELSSSLITRSTALELIKYFNAVQDSIGVSATIAPGWIKKAPHAFINKPIGSRKRVIMRRKGRPRYPTTGKPGYGPPIPALLWRSRILGKVKDKSSDHLYKELADQIAKRTLQQITIAEIE